VPARDASRANFAGFDGQVIAETSRLGTAFCRARGPIADSGSNGDGSERTSWCLNGACAYPPLRRVSVRTDLDCGLRSRPFWDVASRLDTPLAATTASSLSVDRLPPIVSIDPAGDSIDHRPRPLAGTPSSSGSDCTDRRCRSDWCRRTEDDTRTVLVASSQDRIPYARHGVRAGLQEETRPSGRRSGRVHPPVAGVETVAAFRTSSRWHAYANRTVPCVVVARGAASWPQGKVTDRVGCNCVPVIRRPFRRTPDMNYNRPCEPTDVDGVCQRSAVGSLSRYPVGRPIDARPRSGRQWFVSATPSEAGTRATNPAETVESRASRTVGVVTRSESRPPYRARGSTAWFTPLIL